jgi:hypothetical protein
MHRKCHKTPGSLERLESGKARGFGREEIVHRGRIRLRRNDPNHCDRIKHGVDFRFDLLPAELLGNLNELVVDEVLRADLEARFEAGEKVALRLCCCVPRVNRREFKDRELLEEFLHRAREVALTRESAREFEGAVAEFVVDVENVIRALLHPSADVDAIAAIPFGTTSRHVGGSELASGRLDEFQPALLHEELVDAGICRFLKLAARSGADDGESLAFSNTRSERVELRARNALDHCRIRKGKGSGK